ncbi:hypothetical protein BKI52_30375 [marine bacterium AO1-C]|nr:hypothetical protein BKI52_30375 [marine bacterium AO1-C]
MVLKDNQFRCIQQLEEQKILKLTWKDESDLLNNQIATYKALILEWAAIVKRQKPKAVLVDTREHRVIIEPALQAWFVSDIFPKYVQSGMKKLAFLASQDFISQLSIVQTMNEETELPFQTEYFACEKEGFNWVCNQ